jgi:Fur family ferric uptake transcriptional regulator
MVSVHRSATVHHATGIEPLVAALDRGGYRLTAPRRAVAELIVAREGHFSAADLIDDARARRLGIGRATIFRALDLFTELSVLERLDLPTGEHAYVPCEPAGHHHHIVCSGCGRVTEIEEVGLALEDVQRRTGWQVDSHRLELYGRCPRCRSGHSS